MSIGLGTHGYHGKAGIRFVMRAFKTTPTTGYVYWVSLGVPDPTGASSGFNPVDLTDIIIARREQI